jgi:hypothetical protein
VITIDWVLIGTWLAIAILNRAALLPLCVLCVYLFSFELLDSGFAIYIITAIAYFHAAPANITLSSELRHAFLCFGAIYLLGAVDELLYYQLGISTVYYTYMPVIVIALNAYIAALLMRDRRRFDVGIISALGRRLHRRLYGV